VQLPQFSPYHLFQNAHQPFDLGFRTLPILSREGPDGQNLDTKFNAGLQNWA